MSQTMINTVDFPGTSLQFLGSTAMNSADFQIPLRMSRNNSNGNLTFHPTLELCQGFVSIKLEYMKLLIYILTKS